LGKVLAPLLTIFCSTVPVPAKARATNEVQICRNIGFS
jgi:hypothetical protein